MSGLPEGHLVPAQGGAPLWRDRQGSVISIAAPGASLLGGKRLAPEVDLRQLDDAAVLVGDEGGGVFGPSVRCLELVTGKVLWKARGLLISGEAAPLGGVLLAARWGSPRLV